MGRMKAGLALGAATAVAVALSCQTPTSMTVAVSTDVLCQELALKSAANLIVGNPENIVGNLEAASTKMCDTDGPIGEVVLLPKEDESAEVAFKVVLGVGRSSDDCGRVDTGEPGGVWAGCIIARRRLSFLEGEALVVDVPLYEDCIGVPCDEGGSSKLFTTCVKGGRCVPAELDPDDCVVNCGEDALGGAVTSASASVAASTGGGGAASTGGGEPSASSSDASASSTTGGGDGGGGRGGATGGGGGDGGGGGTAGGGEGGATTATTSSGSGGSDCEADEDCPAGPCRVPQCIGGACAESLAAERSACILDGGAGLCTAGGVCVACLAPADCSVPPTAAACFAPLCEPNGTCGADQVTAGDPCLQGGGVCSSLGACVECVSDCPSGLTCDVNVCVPASCNDSAIGGDETDIDCGGDDCAPCPNGGLCGETSISGGFPGTPEDASCQSGNCVLASGPNRYLCQMCTATSDCAVDAFCLSGDCRPRLQDGDVCMADHQCANGACFQDGGGGVCCDAACGGLCESCRGTDTGDLDGRCLPVQDGLDPFEECAMSPCSPGVCDGLASCQVSPTGQSCGASYCDVNGAATVSVPRCDGGGTCLPTEEACPPGEVCTSGMCGPDPSGSTATTGGDPCLFCPADMPICDGQSCCNQTSPPQCVFFQ